MVELLAAVKHESFARTRGRLVNYHCSYSTASAVPLSSQTWPVVHFEAQVLFSVVSALPVEKIPGLLGYSHWRLETASSIGDLGSRLTSGGDALILMAP